MITVAFIMWFEYYPGWVCNEETGDKLPAIPGYVNIVWYFVLNLHDSLKPEKVRKQAIYIYIIIIQFVITSRIK